MINQNRIASMKNAISEALLEMSTSLDHHCPLTVQVQTFNLCIIGLFR